MKEILKGVVFACVFAVPLVVLIVTNDLFFPYVTGKNFAFRILVEVAVGAWILLALLDKAYRPRFSWILASFVGLVGVMAVANAFGVSPGKSFWSNYERMDGWVTLAHLLLYFVVVGSVLTTRTLWARFFGLTLGVAVMEVMYAVSQLASNEVGWRVSGTFGNSTYLGVYMLFHIGIAGLVAAKTEARWIRYTCLTLAVVFTGVLVQTGTRGAVLGLTIGAVVALAYLALFGERGSRMRRYSAIGLAALVLLVGAFVAVRDTSFVREDARLARIANISVSAGDTRFTIWNIAWEGVKERPLLGWGQENFNYVFNKYYEPSLHDQEPWFDRVHNVIFDWLIAGGIFGLLAYLGLFFSSLYYTVLRHRVSKKHEALFTVPEQALILGLLVAYGVHNFFVFDNIGSYMLFVVLLAFVHSRIARPIAIVERLSSDESSVRMIALPVVAVVLVSTLYFVNVPPLRAATELLAGLKEQDERGPRSPDEQLASFEAALSRHSFGGQEIPEQLLRATQQLILEQGLPVRIQATHPGLSGNEILEKVAVVRASASTLAETEMQEEIAAHPDDTRLLFLLGSFYRVTGRGEDARAMLDRAAVLSPQKQLIFFERGFSYLQDKQTAEAEAEFKAALDLAPESERARIYYAIALIYADKEDQIPEVINTPELETEFRNNNLVLEAYYRAEKFDALIDLLEQRVIHSPENVQVRTSLAAILHERDRTPEAIAVLEQAILDFPSFKSQIEAFIEEIRS